MVPTPYDPVEATHFFQWRLVEGTSAGLLLDGAFKPLNTLLIGCDPEPGFSVSGQFPFEMIAEEVEPIGNVGDVGFLHRKLQPEVIPKHLAGFFSYPFRFGFWPITQYDEIVSVTGQNTVSYSSLAPSGFLV